MSETITAPQGRKSPIPWGPTSHIYTARKTHFWQGLNTPVSGRRHRLHYPLAATFFSMTDRIMIQTRNYQIKSRRQAGKHAAGIPAGGTRWAVALPVSRARRNGARDHLRVATFAELDLSGDRPAVVSPQ